MQDQGEDVCGLYDNRHNRTSRNSVQTDFVRYSGPERANLHLQHTQQDNVIPHVGPSYPRYSSYDQRLRSFREFLWPVGLQQRPKQLAEAGFYYKGKMQLA